MLQVCVNVVILMALVYSVADLSGALYATQGHMCLDRSLPVVTALPGA